MTASPGIPPTRCLKLPAWPVADQVAWAASLQQGVTAHWSQATRRMVSTGYGRWLTWLDEQHLLDDATPAADRVTLERLSRYVAALRQGVAEFTVAARIEQLGNALRALAPERHWHWLQHAADQTRAAARAERNRTASAALAGPARAVELAATAAAASVCPTSCLPLAAWPAADQVAWAAALLPGDVLDPGGVAAGWAVATRALVVNGYGRWLTWLAGQGALAMTQPPADRISRERLRAYAAELRATVAPFTVATRIEQLGNAMRALAPAQDWRWIQRAADRIRAAAVPVRDKRARLQSPERLAALGRR